MTPISELAGELKDYYPVRPHLSFHLPWETDDYVQDKKVVIVHGRNLLLNNQFPDKFRRLVNQKLEARGIELVLGDYVATFPENRGGEVVLRSGNKLQAELVVRNPSIVISTLLSLTGLWDCLSGPDVRAQAKYCLDIQLIGPRFTLTWGFREDATHATARITFFHLGYR